MTNQWHMAPQYRAQRRSATTRWQSTRTSGPYAKLAEQAEHYDEMAEQRLLRQAGRAGGALRRDGRAHEVRRDMERGIFGVSLPTIEDGIFEVGHCGRQAPWR